MKIGVISDTHLSGTKCELPEKLLDTLKDCNLILHAGDILEMCVLEELKKISKVEAVYGNMDGPKVKSVLKEKQILDIEGKRICLMHGYGHPDRLVDVLKNEFWEQKPDIIIFGHSHVPKNEYMDGVLFFNPGSATDTIFAPYRSYGIIEIENGKIKAEIHRL
jgi:putative phosphoesterase